MNKRSSADMNWSECFLGVYPLSIQFSRDYNTKFHLYFEKNLQIISRYETPNASIKKQEAALFNAPQKIQHFKIQSDKNLEFQWSLYIQREDIIGNNQEFIEGQKITLGKQLEEYKKSGHNNFQLTVGFNRMKCKFIFLFSISSSPQQLLKSVLKYTSEHKPSVLTSDSHLAAPEVSEVSNHSSSIKKQETLESNNNEVAITRERRRYARDGERVQSPDTRNLKRKPNNGSIIVYQQSSIMQAENKENSALENLSPGTGQFKLSGSDIELGNEIEERINLSETQAQMVRAGGPSPLDSQKNQEKGIRMTSSQLLNQRGEVIVPFYRRKAFIVTIILLVLFFVGKALLSDDKRQKQKQTKDRTGKKDRQAKSEKGEPKKGGKRKRGNKA